MMRLPLTVLLDLWAELVEAHHVKNGFGGNTAELYAHRFLSANSGSNTATEKAKEAAIALWEVLTAFQARYHCRLKVDGERFGEWVKTMNFDHRVHVEVRPQLLSPCCSVKLSSSLGDGVLIGSCSSCYKQVTRVNPKSGIEEWLDGHSPWTEGQLRPA